MADVAFSVFTKSWKTMPLDRLGELVRGLGFEGIEVPVRRGFQVVPGAGARGPQPAGGGSAAPEAAVHPGLYRGAGGRLDLCTLSGPGFGFRLDEIDRRLPEAETVVAGGG